MSLYYYLASAPVAPNTVTIAGAAQSASASLNVQNTPPPNTVTLAAGAGPATGVFDASDVPSIQVSFALAAGAATGSFNINNSTPSDASTLGLVASSATAALGVQNTPPAATLTASLTTSGVSTVFSVSNTPPPNTISVGLAAQNASTALLAVNQTGSPFTPPAPVAPAALILNGLAQEYATDEYIALRAWGDYAALCPPSQKIAVGSDGTFSPSDPWTLNSASVYPLAYGLQSGHVVLLKLGNTFGSNGELFAVNSVGAQSITLRRLGMPAAVGLPPSPSTGLSGVQFTVLTFGPQIDNASYDANKFFGIDPNTTIYNPARLYDPRELQQWTVLTVLERTYAIALKSASGDYEEKLRQVRADLNELKSRLVIRWGALGLGDAPVTAMSARIRR